MKTSKRFIIFLVSFCCLSGLLLAKEKITYPCTIFFINGHIKTANMEIPEALKTSLYVQTGDTATTIPADSIDKVAIQTTANVTLEFYYRDNGRRKVWVYKKCEGANASAYIGALIYKINEDGTPRFVGVSMHVANRKDTTTFHSSFPLYIIRKKDKQLQWATFISEQPESSAFRKGISRILKDDPMLCEYIHEQKWDYRDIQNIIENYEPNRREIQLSVNGKIAERKPQKLITENLNNKMIFFVDYLLPNKEIFDIYGSQVNLGVRSTVVRFFTYSAGIGYGKAKYVDNEKLSAKYPELWQQEIEVAPDDFSKTDCFNATISIGGQLPFRIQRFYLIPAAGWNLGTLWSMNFATSYHGLQLSFDCGYKMKYGSILFAGLSFRQMNSLKKKQDEDNWVFHSHPRFFKYPDINSIALRIGYKF